MCEARGRELWKWVGSSRIKERSAPGSQVAESASRVRSGWPYFARLEAQSRNLSCGEFPDNGHLASFGLGALGQILRGRVYGLFRRGNSHVEICE